jgi:hypothetical protein
VLFAQISKPDPRLTNEASGIDQALMGKAGCRPKIPGQPITKFAWVHQGNVIASISLLGYAEVTIDELPCNAKRISAKKQVKGALMRQRFRLRWSWRA